MEYVSHQNDSILLDSDTEFIHFSESIDNCDEEVDETFANLENCHPNIDHVHYNAQLDQLKTAAPDVVANTINVNIQRQENTPITFSQKGIRLRDILKVTGRFDSDAFNKQFDAESERIIKANGSKEEKLKRNSKPEAQIETLKKLEAIPYPQNCTSLPRNENHVKRILNARVLEKRPISEWFLRQLIGMEMMSEKDTNDGGSVNSANLIELNEQYQFPLECIYHSCKDVDHFEEEELEEEPTSLEIIEIEDPHLQTVEVEIMEVTDEFLASSPKIAEAPVYSPISECPTSPSSSVSSFDSGINSPPPQSVQDPKVFPGKQTEKDVNTVLKAVESSPVKLKMTKRQLRMMKNRESASNSRKKKKEYVTKLESQLQMLANIATTLKEENKKLKSLIFDEV